MTSFEASLQVDREEQKSAILANERLYEELHDVQRRNANLQQAALQKQHELEMMQQKRQAEADLATERKEAERAVADQKYRAIEQQMEEQVPAHLFDYLHALMKSPARKSNMKLCLQGRHSLTTKRSPPYKPSLTLLLSHKHIKTAVLCIV